NQHVDSIFTSGDAETAEFRSNPASNVGDTQTVEFRKIPKILAGLTLRTPQRPKGERFCIPRSNIVSRGRTALLNALNITFLRSSVTELRCSKISENSKIVTGLTLPTPERPKLARFCIRRSKVINRSRIALQNALNRAFLRSKVTEIRCCTFGEKHKILG